MVNVEQYQIVLGSGDDAVTLGAFDLLHDDEGFVLIIARHRERRAAILAQRRIDRLRGALDVLRVVVNAANDDEVLDPAGDEEFAVGIEEAEIGGAKPARLAGLTFDPGEQFGRCRGLVSPI